VTEFFFGSKPTKLVSNLTEDILFFFGESVEERGIFDIRSSFLLSALCHKQVKRGKKGLSLSAEISTSLDVGRAHNTKQIRMAHEEALAIAKVLQQSKQDLGVGKIIYKHSKSKGGTKDWDNFWDQKHSLVSRLAAEVGKEADTSAAKKGVVVSKAQAVKQAQAAVAAKKAHEVKMAQVQFSWLDSGVRLVYVCVFVYACLSLS